jgi:hypothetical protein
MKEFYTKMLPFTCNVCTDVSYKLQPCWLLNCIRCFSQHYIWHHVLNSDWLVYVDIWEKWVGGRSVVCDWLVFQLPTQLLDNEELTLGHRRR